MDYIHWHSGIRKRKKGKMRIKVYLFESRIVKGDPQPLECQDVKIIDIEELDNFALAPVDKKIALFLKEN